MPTLYRKLGEEIQCGKLSKNKFEHKKAMITSLHESFGEMIKKNLVKVYWF